MFLNDLLGRQKTEDQSWKLPCTTESICPECLKVLDAELREEDGKVFMFKECAEHGEYRELISSDVDFFEKLRRTHYERPVSLANPQAASEKGCPFDCGICENHQSTPAMINIDLTNRCNLNCPICFANANASGKLFELSLEQLEKMLDEVASFKPVTAECVQYAGGEPTVYPHFFEAIKMASDRKFSQIQVASNGIKFARSLEFCERAAEAGLEEIYLQFDGMSDDIYKQSRGRPMFETKMQAIENIKRAGMRIALVPTIVRGLNDHQLGDILKFAIDNVDVISAVSWQPVAITGRIDEEKRREMRFTTADLARNLQEQTGIIDMYRDWYPFSIVAPIVRLLDAVTKSSHLHVSCHPHCGCATYLLVDKETNTAYPFPEFMDLEPAMESLDKEAKRIENHPWLKNYSLMQSMNTLKKYFYNEKIGKKDWKFDDLMSFITGFMEDDKYKDTKEYMEKLKSQRYGILFSASMHFQDSYNYELDRTRHCVVWYGSPDGKFYPFCTYNSGPCHRNSVEEAFSRPLNEND